MSSPRFWRRPATPGSRSIDGTRPERWWWGLITTSATSGCGRPRGPSWLGRRSSRSIWTRDSRSGRGCSTRAAAAWPRRSPWHRVGDQSRSASRNCRSFSSPSSGWVVPPTRRPWSATASRPTSKAGAAGMFTIWIDPEDDDPKPDSADLKVRDLAELHQLWRQARSESQRNDRPDRESLGGTGAIDVKAGARRVSPRAARRPRLGWPCRRSAS